MVQRISSPVFIGRQAELERVDALRAQTRSTSSGTTILVSGEAGIGKTRFLRELVARAGADGWLTLMGACDEFGATARPFSALTEMIGALSVGIESNAPDEFDRPAWRTIQALATGEKRPEDAGSVVQLALDLLRRLSVVRPLLVVMDDLHWADESTRGLFETLARGLQGTRSMLIGAYRGNEVDRGHPLRPVLSAIHRNLHPEVMELQPFSADEAADLARTIGGKALTLSLDSIFERSGGNAFFLEELLAAREGGIPHGIQDVVLARLDALGAEAVSVAEAAALDTALDGLVIATVSGLAPAAFAPALDRLTDAGILVARGEAYAFRHALIREVVYDQIAPRRRSELHGQAAVALEASARPQAGRVATHWRRSADKARALVTAIAAAEHAFYIGALPESADWYEAALDLWDQVPDAESLAGCSRAALVLQTDEPFAACRRFNRSIELIERVVATPRGLSNAERAELWLQLSLRCWQASGNEARTTPLAIEAFQKARVALDEEMPPSDRVRLLSLYVVSAIQRYGLEAEAAQALETAFAVVAEYPEAHHPVLDGARNWVLVSTGSDEIFDALEQQPDVRLAHDLVIKEAVEANLLKVLGFHALTIARARTAIGTLNERGLPLVGFPLEAYLAGSLSAVGRWREGLERWEATKARIGPEPLVEWSTLVIVAWGALFTRSGRSAEAKFFAEDASRWVIPYEMVPFLASEALVRVEFARIDHDADAARRAISEAIDLVRGHYMAVFGEPVAYAIASEADAAFETGRRDPESVALADHWIQRVRSCLDFAPGRVRLWDLGMFIDQACAERARLAGEDSVDVWEDLAARWQALPRPYHEAYCRYRAAFALLMAPVASERKLARERAAAHLETALTISKELGAIYLAADIDSLSRTSGIRPRSSSKPVASAEAAAPEGPGLTSRELEVLRLLVAGESNGQIAIRLGISVKTASVHVSNILRKLDAENRVEAAVRASRTGILDLR